MLGKNRNMPRGDRRCQDRTCHKRAEPGRRTGGDPTHDYDDFFLGILAPERRASLNAIATACLRLFTFFPLLDLSFPSLCSFMTLWILRFPLELDRKSVV